jgi:BspA type Leucine rich repeat region (6 copies)
MNTRPQITQAVLLVIFSGRLQAQMTNGFSYNTTADATVTITAYDCRSNAVVIPGTIAGLPVTDICGSAFQDCGGLTNLTIPDGVIRIGDGAFRQTGLTKVTIPESVTNIGSDVFSGDSLGEIIVAALNPAYTNVEGVLFDKSQSKLIAFPGGRAGHYTIPRSVTDIGDYTFHGCANLTSVTIPNSVTNIGDRAFEGCIGLTNVTIPDGVITIGYESFSDCSGLTSVTLPKSATSIGVGVFSGDGQLDPATGFTALVVNGSILINGITCPTNPSTLVIPSTVWGKPVTTIGDLAFHSCRGVTNVTIPEGVTRIGAGAFVQTGLTQLTIPNGVTNIAIGAFEGCSLLKTILIPDGVSSIADSVFADCRFLTSVELPHGIVNIGNDAFQYCDSLPSVAIPNSVTNIGDGAFQGCLSLTNITIPDGVISIGFDAFSITALTEVTIPHTVAIIGMDVASGSNLSAAYFMGDDPSDPQDGSNYGASDAFDGAFTTVYYLPGTRGWEPFLSGGYIAQTAPIAAWVRPDPVILDFEPSFGTSTNGFGFTISWATNATVVVEASTNFGLNAANWSPISTNTITYTPGSTNALNGTSDFADPQWTNYPGRFYRLRW